VKRRLLRILSVVLITAGLVIFIDVGLTLAWKEPLSTVYGSIQQGQAEDQLNDLEKSFPANADLAKVSHIRNIRKRVHALADIFEKQVVGSTGKGIGRIIIPRMDLDIVVVQGTDTSSLQKGPGHYTASPNPATAEAGDGSAFPGQGKTVGIAGHRTTYLAPFRRLDELKPGDEIKLELPYGTFTYKMQKTKIVDPNAIGIVHDVGYDRLVLTACNPLYSASQRIAAFAKLDKVSLFGGGGRIWQDP
jgi:sortase A